MDDFLIVYHNNDRQRAHLIYDWLADSDYNVNIGSLSSDNGQTFASIIDEASQKAVRVLVLISSELIEELIQEENWKETLTSNPSRDFNFIIPVTIEPLDLKQLAVQKVYIDLSELKFNKAKIPFIFALRKLINSSSDSELIKTFL